MSRLMPHAAQRLLTEGESAALSAGLVRALNAADVQPTIVARPAIGAKIARLWRGSVPILAWYDRIFWPGALEDMSPDLHRMSVLQHELQHVLEYRTGALNPLSYALRPRNWRYHYKVRADAAWSDFGAEQRAEIVEDLWLIEKGLKVGSLTWYRDLIPWA